MGLEVATILAMLRGVQFTFVDTHLELISKEATGPVLRLEVYIRSAAMFYKNRRMRELDQGVGDVYTMIGGESPHRDVWTITDS